MEIFKQWAGDRKDVRLLVVGARYVRQYEIDYVEKVKSIIDGDARIELHEVTNDVDAYYRQSDALLFTSLNGFFLDAFTEYFISSRVDFAISFSDATYIS